MLEHWLAEGSLKGAHYAETQLIAVLGKKDKIIMMVLFLEKALGAVTKSQI